MTEDIPGALRAAAEIEQSWLENNRLEERVLEILASSHAHLQQWMEVFSVCERYQQLLEQRPQVEEQPLQEIHRWRREAARGLLLQQEDETTASESFRSGPWEERLREKIREEVLAQQAESHEAIAMKQALLEAERHQFTTLLDLLSGPSSHGKPPLSQRLLQLRESTLTRVRSLPPEESEKAKELQEQYLLSLQQIVAEYQEGRLGDGIFLQTWGEERWNRLPTNARQLLQSAEVLYSLLEAQPGQDHAPILMQWARAAEVVCNLRLADNLASFALKKGLSLHDLPSFGGRPLEKAGNQLSLGAFPYLLAERWKKREGGVMKDAFNHQWTDSLQRLWEEVEASMKEARVGEEQRRYLFEELPSECQRWALWRNQFSHAAGSLHREELDKLREELLLSTQNLFTMVSTLPVL